MTYEEGQAVDIEVLRYTNLGVVVLVDNRIDGLVFDSDIFQPLEKGQKLQGWIKTIREDGKFDIVLKQPGYEHVDPLAEKIIQALNDANGFLPLHDKSQPTEIEAKFECSKKSFKKAIGSLYKNRQIVIKPEGIYLTD